MMRSRVIHMVGKLKERPPATYGLIIQTLEVADRVLALLFYRFMYCYLLGQFVHVISQL